MNARWLVMSVLFWGSAWAQSTTIAGESPRTGMLEIKLGNLKPLIDREPALADLQPFTSTFGTANLLLGEIEYDRQFFQEFGSLGLGFSVGYAEKFAPAKLAAESGLVDATSSESTGFKMVPMKALLVYRLDAPALRWGFPLVPYVKGGLAYTGWWVTKGNDVEFSEGVRGMGGTWGYAGVVGMSVLLDFFDRRLARDFDTGLGVNHTYFFGEYVYEEVNDFGRGGLDLSSRHWMFGLSFEF